MSERVDGQSQHKVLTLIPEALHYLRDVSLLRRSHHYPQNLINTSMSLRLSRSHLLLMILCHIWRKEGLSERKWRKSSFCTVKTFFLKFCVWQMLVVVYYSLNNFLWCFITIAFVYRGLTTMFMVLSDYCDHLGQSSQYNFEFLKYFICVF